MPKTFALGLCVQNMIQDSNEGPTDEQWQERPGAGKIK